MQGSAGHSGVREEENLDLDRIPVSPRLHPASQRPFVP